MASTSLLRNAGPLRLAKIRPATFTSTSVKSSIGRRHIGQKYLAKVAEAQKNWEEQAKKNHENNTHFLDLLEERGFVHQLAG